MLAPHGAGADAADVAQVAAGFTAADCRAQVRDSAMAISVLPAPAGTAPCLWSSARQARVSRRRPICSAHVARATQPWIGA
eukprot:14255698-Alexandrium_andersonii.AAC.1